MIHFHKNLIGKTRWRYLYYEAFYVRQVVSCLFSLLYAPLLHHCEVLCMSAYDVCRLWRNNSGKYTKANEKYVMEKLILLLLRSSAPWNLKSNACLLEVDLDASA